MTDILDDIQQRITRRLAELKPLVAEHHRLEAAAAALEGIPAAADGGSATSPPPTRNRRGPGRPRGSKTKTTAITASTPASPKPASGKPTAKRTRRRRKGTGKRATQAYSSSR